MIAGKTTVLIILTACLRLQYGMKVKESCLQQETVLEKNLSFIFLTGTVYYLPLK